MANMWVVRLHAEQHAGAAGLTHEIQKLGRQCVYAGETAPLDG
jgi:hypothetical protein